MKKAICIIISAALLMQACASKTNQIIPQATKLTKEGPHPGRKKEGGTPPEGKNPEGERQEEQNPKGETPPDGENPKEERSEEQKPEGDTPPNGENPNGEGSEEQNPKGEIPHEEENPKEERSEEQKPEGDTPPDGENPDGEGSEEQKPEGDTPPNGENPNGEGSEEQNPKGETPPDGENPKEERSEEQKPEGDTPPNGENPKEERSEEQKPEGDTPPDGENPKEERSEEQNPKGDTPPDGENPNGEGSEEQNPKGDTPPDGEKPEGHDSEEKTPPNEENPDGEGSEEHDSEEKTPPNGENPDGERSEEHDSEEKTPPNEENPEVETGGPTQTPNPDEQTPPEVGTEGSVQTAASSGSQNHESASFSPSASESVNQPTTPASASPTPEPAGQVWRFAESESNPPTYTTTYTEFGQIIRGNSVSSSEVSDAYNKPRIYPQYTPSSVKEIQGEGPSPISFTGNKTIGWFGRAYKWAKEHPIITTGAVIIGTGGIGLIVMLICRRMGGPRMEGSLRTVAVTAAELEAICRNPNPNIFYIYRPVGEEDPIGGGAADIRHGNRDRSRIMSQKGIFFRGIKKKRGVFLKHFRKIDTKNMERTFYHFTDNVPPGKISLKNLLTLGINPDAPPGILGTLQKGEPPEQYRGTIIPNHQIGARS